MKLADGCHLISYHELAKTDEGKLAWQNYISRIIDIALQYPDHFFPETSEKIIPRDAKNHHLYIHSKNDELDAFCIITIYCDVAEYLWAATQRDTARKGVMQELYWFIEDRIKDEEPEVERIIAMCASLDSKIVNDSSLTEEEKKRRKEAWRGTHIFHQKMNFDFTYELKHYWGIGYHALVCMKVRANFGLRERSQCTPYGYSSFPSPIVLSQFGENSFKKSDKNFEINKKIQAHIRACLDAFDEAFVRNVQPGTSGKEEYIFKDTSEKNSDNLSLKLKGFTGLALVNPYSNIATAFAHTSKDLNLSSTEIYHGFEYSIQAPGFLQQIISEPTKTGYLIHSTDLAERSEINLRLYFDKYYSSDESKTYKGDYTIFYRKRMGKDGFYSILYFGTPLIPNILWYEDLWKSYADYSFALILVILGYFSSVKVLDSSLRKSKYFDGLMKAVSPSGVDDDFAEEITRISENIAQRTDKHYSALVDQKNRAFKSTGHLMRNRCDNLLRLLKFHPQINLSQDSPIYRNLDSLSGFYQAQQLWGFDSLEEIHDEYANYSDKLKRFFEKDDTSFDLASFLYEEASLVTELKEYFLGHQKFFVSLDVKRSKKYEFHLKPTLVFSGINQDTFRLNKLVLSNIFFEIFLNVARHGAVNPSGDLNQQGRGTVSVFFKKDEIEDLPVITIANPVLVTQKSAVDKFEKLPIDSFRKIEGDLGSGLGGIAEYLSRLNLGGIWERRFNYQGHDFYEVAINLNGLEIIEITPG